MPPQHRPDAWHVVVPSQWAPVPRWMSFSTLMEIEACPRRWALRTAGYPTVWEGSGYPPAPQIAAIEGVIVHAAIDLITNALAESGCASIRDARAIEVLRGMGGYTSIITAIVSKAVADYESNPRARAALESIQRKLTSRVPELRSRVQRQISRIDLTARRTALEYPPNKPAAETRFPLSEGAYPEVNVRVPELQWHGVIDLLTISATCCEIRDFKTGSIKEQDRLQLRIYALLWARDRDLNPTGRLAGTLVISYDDREVTALGPDHESLSLLEAEVRQRTTAALAATAAHPPAAKPSVDNCAHCYVRHLCDEYWQWLQCREPTSTRPTTPFADIQVKITGRHGPSSWDGMMGSHAEPTENQPVLLRTANTTLKLQPGQRLRILNAHLGPRHEKTGDDDDVPTVATIGASSEVFLLVS